MEKMLLVYLLLLGNCMSAMNLREPSQGRVTLDELNVYKAATLCCCVVVQNCCPIGSSPSRYMSLNKPKSHEDHQHVSSSTSVCCFSNCLESKYDDVPAKGNSSPTSHPKTGAPIFDNALGIYKK